MLSISSGTFSNKVYLRGSQILFCHSLLQKLFKEYDNITALLKKKRKLVLLKFDLTLLLARTILRVVFSFMFQFTERLFRNGIINISRFWTSNPWHIKMFKHKQNKNLNILNKQGDLVYKNNTQQYWNVWPIPNSQSNDVTSLCSLNSQERKHIYYIPLLFRTIRGLLCSNRIKLGLQLIKFALFA